MTKMYPQVINPETLDTLVKAAKIGGLIVGLSALGTVVTFSAIYSGIKTIESDLGDQILRYKDDLDKYRIGELKERPKFRNYKIK